MKLHTVILTIIVVLCYLVSSFITLVEIGFCAIGGGCDPSDQMIMSKYSIFVFIIAVICSYSVIRIFKKPIIPDKFFLLVIVMLISSIFGFIYPLYPYTQIINLP